MGESSPMLDQYRRIKREQQGNILFFRLGDFYEMFAEDALEVSSLLNLTLTSRSGLPMCGVPYHAVRVYIARLLKLGKKIAICEQLSPAGRGNKVIERQVVEIITPGTTVEDDYLDKGNSNYLACIAFAPGGISFSYIDISSGDFYASFFQAGQAAQMLRQELERLQIRELLVQESLLEENSDIAEALHERNIILNRWADWLFDSESSFKRLCRQFSTVNLKSFGIEKESPLIVSAGALLDYLDRTAKSLIPHVVSLMVYQDNDYVGIDESSQRNLELVRNLRDGSEKFSLLEVLDETRCAMGLRLLKRRILHPLRNLRQITARLDMVESLYRDQGLLARLRECLSRTGDLERLCSRLAMDKAHARDMLAIKNALDSFKNIAELASTLGFRFETVESGFTDCVEALVPVRNLLSGGICEDPSILLNEGNLIKSGFSKELDQLRDLRDSGRKYLEEYLEEERAATGITNLKIRYNRLIGYFFEVTKFHLSRVPSYFIRRQGIAGGERFTTDRLAALESEINGASDKVIETEKKLFLEIREKAKGSLAELIAAAKIIAELDAAQSLARAASVRAWVRPALDESGDIEINEGRHPVVEAHMGSGEFMPNSICLSAGNKSGEASFVLITGPNMAGKSTYLRSAALIALMAQMGSFVPAREARIGICDRIYCRVGASDNLSRGESTFLVEMTETAYILNTATEKSLVIMDEVGRGTGTNDGLSIAWSVSEELLNRIRCRTLFATHYHELSLLSHPRIINRSMEVLDQGDEIVFLRKLKEGPAAQSYGIHVAKLAGLSPLVIGRAEEIMSRLKKRDTALEQALLSGAMEESVNPENIAVNQNAASESGKRAEDREISRQNFDYKAFNELSKQLAAVDPEQITPIESLHILAYLKSQMAQARGEKTEKTPAKKTAGKDGGEPSLFDV
jgi:DNA mismatch repair protein MutS